MSLSPHNWTLTFRVHAVQRMFERCISAAVVREALESGEVIADYADDKPYPSKLVLAYSEGRPIHIVVAENALEGEKIVITAYEPDKDVWEPNFRRRRL